MKWMLPLLFLAGAASAPAYGESLVRLDSPQANSFVAAYRQVDVRFSETFSKGHRIASDFDGVKVTSLSAEQICLREHKQGLYEGNPKLKDVAPRYLDGICVARSEVAARVKPQFVPGAPKPPIYGSDTARCYWRWIRGGAIGLWGESCRHDRRHADIVYDAKKQTFSLRVNGRVDRPVLRQFHKPPGRGPEAIMKALKADGLIRDDADCKFVPYTRYPAPPGWSIWTVILTGSRAQIEASKAHHSEHGGYNCGELSDFYSNGPMYSIFSFFMISDVHPDRVFHVYLPDHEAMIDPFSVTVF